MEMTTLIDLRDIREGFVCTKEELNIQNLQ